MTPKPSFLKAEALSYSYGEGTPWKVPALQNVSLDVAAGEIVGLIGPTGSGKSTLLQHLCGLIRPLSGRVSVGGLELSLPGTDLRQIRRQVGMVFQQPEDQLFERYVGDDVAFGPRNAGLPRDEVRRRVEAAMNATGLPFERFKDRLTVTLSGGERRKAGIAGVLAMQPQALLLDEPTAGLDPASREELLALVAAWRRERNLAVVVSSHNMDDIARLADRVVVLGGGRVVLAGRTAEVFSQGETLSSLGLAAPSATEILAALADRGLVDRRVALSISDAADAIEATLAPRLAAAKGGGPWASSS